MTETRSFKRIGINMMSGGAGYIIPMAVNFLSTPFLLKHLGEESFGLQSLVNVILGYLMVADMGLDIPITKFLAEFSAKGELQNRKKLLSNTLQLYFIIGSIGMLIIFLAEPYMYDLFNIPDSLKPEAKIVFWLTGVGFLGNIISMWGKATFIGIQRYDIANGIYIAFNLLSTVTGLIMVYQKLGIIYFVAAKVVGFFLSALSYILCTNFFLKDFKFSFGFDRDILNKIKVMIGYGFALRIAGMIFAKLDQSLISAWVSIGAVGIYSIAYLINSAISGFISGIMNFTFPKASELLSTNRIEEYNELFRVSSKYCNIIASFFFSFLIATGDKFITLWINEGTAVQMNDALLILSIAFFLSSVSSTINNNFIVAKTGMFIFTIYGIVRSSLMAVGFILLIKPYGLTGAAIVVLGAGIFDFIFMLVCLKIIIKLSFIDLAFSNFVKPFILGIISGTLVYFNRNLIDDWKSYILTGICYSLLFLALAIVMNVFGEREKLILQKVLARIKGTYSW